MFGKVITLNRVRDSVTFREGNEEIRLKVDSEVNGLMKRIISAEKKIMAITAETARPEKTEAAREFAVAIFGEEQAEKIFEFYNGNEECVITICGMYFSDKKHGLCRKITKAQKKLK